MTSTRNRILTMLFCFSVGAACCQATATAQTNSPVQQISDAQISDFESRLFNRLNHCRRDPKTNWVRDLVWYIDNKHSYVQDEPRLKQFILWLGQQKANNDLPRPATLQNLATGLAAGTVATDRLPSNVHVLRWPVVIDPNNKTNPLNDGHTIHWAFLSKRSESGMRVLAQSLLDDEVVSLGVAYDPGKKQAVIAVELTKGEVVHDTHIVAKAHAAASRFDSILKDFVEKAKVTQLTANLTFHAPETVNSGLIELLSKSYGVQKVEVTRPYRLASVSKRYTEYAIRKLVEGKSAGLTYDTLAFQYIGFSDTELTGDPRLKSITVRHLLEHRGGWDKEMTHKDFMFSLSAEQYAASSPKPPVGFQGAMPVVQGAQDHWRIINHVVAKEKLQHDPGKEGRYSNFGYSVLGRVIEQASVIEQKSRKPPQTPIKKSYVKYIKEDLLQRNASWGASSVAVGADAHTPAEADYRGQNGNSVEPSGRYYWSPAKMDAHGGLIANAQDVARFFRTFRVPAFTGSIDGCFTQAGYRGDGYTFAVLMNKRANSASSAQEVVEFQNIFSKLGKSLDASVPQISTYLNGANGNPPRMVQLSPKSNPRLVLTDTVDGPILAPRDPGLKAHQRWILRPMIHDGNTLLEMTMSTAFRERQNPSQVTAGDASRKLHLHWTEKRTTGGIDGMRWKIVVTGELGWYGLSIIPYYNVNKFLAAPVGVNDPRWTSKPRADAFDDSQKWRITTF